LEAQVPHRILGLDVLRSSAISLVIYSHLSNFLTRYFPVLEIFELPDGVNLFFVLSGFLIGQIILHQLQIKEKFALKDVVTFLKRRWWRTLPNYYLFLVLNLLLIYWQQIPGELHKYNFLYFGFLQNFIIPFDFMFWESWSLSIEEWFYFAFPILVFLVLKLLKWKKETVYVLVCSLFIFVPFLIRCAVSLPNGYYEQWDLWYRKLVITHLDAIGYGMLSAYFLQNKSNVLCRYKWPFLIIGITVLVVFSNLSYDNNVLLYKTAYLSFMAVAASFMLPVLSETKVIKVGANYFTKISKWSYSLYLIHLPLLYVMDNNLRVEDGTDALIFSAIYLVISFSLAALLYRFYEKPLMDRRDKEA
jgi:peptidoglycan/LPS O-acetylase OafA/YrhL